MLPTDDVWHGVLVLGGAGFIGSNLIELILQRNLASVVISLDNYTSGSTANHIKDDRVRYFDGSSWDILQSKNSDFQSFCPDVVFHLGEFSRIITSFSNVNYVFESNSLGTQRILEYCVRKKAKLIYSGSSSTFGNDGQDANLSPYAFLKRQNVLLIQNYAEWFGLKYAIATFYNVYGTRDIEEGEYATVVATFRRQFAAAQPLTVVLPGTQRRIFTHVHDIVDGLLLVAKRGEGDGYKLAGDDDVSIVELANMFGTAITYVPERRGERFSSVCESSRARTELGWAPRVSLASYVEMFQQVTVKEKEHTSIAGTVETDSPVIRFDL
jgi:UDP-glucose 4-epimerase